LDAEMSDFLLWFNRPEETDPVVKAGLAHLWFVTSRAPVGAAPATT
jgi:Fic family protein